MQKDKSKKQVRWSFEPSAETVKAWKLYLASKGMAPELVNKSATIDALLLNALRDETPKAKE